MGLVLLGGLNTGVELSLTLRHLTLYILRILTKKNDMIPIDSSVREKKRMTMPKTIDFSSTYLAILFCVIFPSSQRKSVFHFGDAFKGCFFNK